MATKWPDGTDGCSDGANNTTKSYEEYLEWKIDDVLRKPLNNPHPQMETLPLLLNTLMRKIHHPCRAEFRITLRYHHLKDR
jgi:hypothetical protein